MGHPESLPVGAPRKMLRLLTLILLLVTWPAAAWMPARLEEDVLLDVKAALDPHGEVLMSWQAGGRPCSGAFEGVLCDTGYNLVCMNKSIVEIKSSYILLFLPK